MAGGVYGTRLYGEVERVPGLFAVVTVFSHVNYLPLIPEGTYVVHPSGQTEKGFRGQQIGLSMKSVVAGYLRGWSAGVAAFFAGVAGLGGTAFFIGHQGTEAAAIAFSVAAVLACGFWFVIASRSWLLAMFLYGVLAAVTFGSWRIAFEAIQKNPALWQAKENEFAAFPAMLLSHGAVLLATLTRVFNRCSYDRALALANVLGIDPQQIAVRYGESLTAPSPLREDFVNDRFTDRARKVIHLANLEARRWNHEYLGTEHLFLGLIRENSGVAANLLNKLVGDNGRLQKELEKLLIRGPALFSTDPPLLTPRARRAIESAKEEAQILNHNYVGTEHLLLGLLRDPDGVVSCLLQGIGIRADDIRSEVLVLLGVKSKRCKT